MTDRDSEQVGAESHLDDERLSSLIDGEAAPADIEHAAHCPDCHARLDTWKQMRAIIATPPTAPSAEQREAAIAAAMASQPLAEPTPLEERRRRRAGHLIGTRAAAIAAVVVLAAGVGVAAADLAGRGGTNHASVASRGEVENGIASSLPGPSSAGTTSLGPVSSTDQLVALIRGQLSPVGASTAEVAPTETSTEPRAEPPETCLSTASRLGGAGSVQPAFVATLTYRGTPATVFVFQFAGRHVAVVTGDTGCRLLARVGF